MNKLQKVGVVLGIILSLGTITSSVAAWVYFSIDTAIAGEAQKRDEGDLASQLELSELELKYLRNRAELDADDAARISFLEARRAVLLARFAELQK